MLEKNECERLLMLARSGDESAKTRLVEENTPLVKSIVARYKNRGVEYDDLFQLGMLGFVKAINNFDLSFNVRFSTYAVPLIMGEIKRFLRDDGYIKVSRQVKHQFAKIRRFCEEYRLSEKHEPSVETIAENFGLDATEVVFILDSNKMPVSIYDTGDGDEKSLTVLDKLESPEKMDQSERITLFDELEKLDKRDKKIIILRYFRDKTQGEIAEMLGISQVQVSRLESKILKNMKEKMNGEE